MRTIEDIVDAEVDRIHLDIVGRFVSDTMLRRVLLHALRLFEEEMALAAANRQRHGRDGKVCACGDPRCMGVMT